MLSLWGKPPTDLRIEPVRTAGSRRGCRVAARVDGREIAFESADGDLAAAPEAFASLLLIPATAAGRTLRPVDPVCPTWAANAPHIIRKVAGWWNYAGGIECTPGPVAQAPVAEGAALCFSGGADSFHALLRGEPGLKALVCAIGYDVRPGDRARIAGLTATVDAVAAECGLRSVRIESDLRSHPLLKGIAWDRSHGGALAALGHLLRQEFGELRIASSTQRTMEMPWGSRWDLDPLFSSATMKIEHVGSERFRVEKVFDIAHEPLVRRHLRVCWKARGVEANCGVCEKCIRTRLTLEACGAGANYPQFGRREDLAAAVDRLQDFPASLISYRKLLEMQGLPRTLAAAVTRYTARGEAAQRAANEPKSQRRAA